MRQTALLIALFVSGSAAFAADPTLLGLVMPDAKILAGVNAANVRNSVFAQFIISKFGLAGKVPQDFITATGFDPLQDVLEVLAATTADPAHPAGLLLVRGHFRPDLIVSALGPSSPLVQTYNGVTLITRSRGNGSTTSAVAFVSNNSVAVAGDLASVESAIDRGGSSVLSVLSDTALAERVDVLSRNQDEWLVSSVPIASLIPANAPAQTGVAAQVLPILQKIQSFSGGVNYATGALFTGQAVTDTADNAKALSAVVTLALTLISANAGNDPHLAQVLHLLQPLSVTQSDKAIDFSLSIKESDLEALVNTVPVQVVPSAVPHRREPSRRN